MKQIPLRIDIPLKPITLQDEIDCVRREIKMRERVYEWRVKQGKMTEENAQWEIRLMGAVLARLLKLV